MTVKPLTLTTDNCLEPLEIASDYMDPSTIKIKKPKKKKQKHTTRVTALPDDEGLGETNTFRSGPPADNITLAPLSSTKRAYNEDSGVGDDEELQAMLAQRRRQALKRKKISRFEDIVRNIHQSRDDEDIGASENGGLVIDDTSEFVRGLEMSQLERTTSAGLLSNRNPPEEMDIDATGDIKDIEMPDQLPEDVVVESNEIVPSSALDDEPIVASSLAATLAALKRTGMLFAFPSQSNYSSGEIGSATVSSNFSIDDLEKREEIIARQRIRRIQQEADARGQREQERQNERFNRLSQREKEQHREQENQARERHEAQQRMREFSDFKFNVDLEYKDEFGQEMTKKDVRLHSSIID
jgi:U4/U6.U5 tri-snRNP-associated protein 1